MRAVVGVIHPPDLPVRTGPGRSQCGTGLHVAGARHLAHGLLGYADGANPSASGRASNMAAGSGTVTAVITVAGILLHFPSQGDRATAAVSYLCCRRGLQLPTLRYLVQPRLCYV